MIENKTNYRALALEAIGAMKRSYWIKSDKPSNTDAIGETSYTELCIYGSISIFLLNELQMNIL